MHVHSRPVAEPCEESPYLRLEYDDQGQHADIQHHVHNGGGEPHAEYRDGESYEIQGKDGHEYAPR